MAPNTGEIFAATYSSVPVYELNVDNNHVMRRRSDDYINATHILKVADYDKPARTRILEREVQKGVHEKIQGGYGKYQGTWIPLPDGKVLAQRNHVYEKLQPIFDYVASNVSPPPAPKHSTNPSRPKVPKIPGVKKGPRASKQNLMSDDYDNMSTQLRDDDSQDAETIETASFMDGDDGYGTQYIPGSLKRKRGQQDVADQQHTLFADTLLDYFIVSSSEGVPHRPPPRIPRTFEINRTIDDQGHTALHWAVAMGDLDLVKVLIERGANINVRNKRGETPLIRAVIFTNNFEKKTMPDILSYLQSSLEETDNFHASVLHHTVMTTNSRLRKKCAHYYIRVLLQALRQSLSDDRLQRFLDLQDRNDETALHIAAKFDAKRCVCILEAQGAHVDIPNRRGETADQIFTNLQAVQQEMGSSSPLQIDMDPIHGVDGIKTAKVGPMAHYHSEHARSFSQSFDSMAQEKSLQIALAIEKESRDRIVALEEAQQAAEKVERDRQQVHQATVQYLSQTSTHDDEELARLEEEFNTLIRHGEAFSEQVQHRELHSAIRDAESQLPKDAHFAMSNGLTADDHALEERVRAGLDLSFEQNKRRKLTTETTEARALAGMSPTGEALKRLVAETTGVSMNEAVQLAPELLEELQDSKMEIAGPIPVGA